MTPPQSAETKQAIKGEPEDPVEEKDDTQCDELLTLQKRNNRILIIFRF